MVIFEQLEEPVPDETKPETATVIESETDEESEKTVEIEVQAPQSES